MFEEDARDALIQYLGYSIQSVETPVEEEKVEETVAVIEEEPVEEYNPTGEIKTITCPECGNKIEMAEGCFICLNCGYSGCS